MMKAIRRVGQSKGQRNKQPTRDSFLIVSSNPRNLMKKANVLTINVLEPFEIDRRNFQGFIIKLKKDVIKLKNYMR